MPEPHKGRPGIVKEAEPAFPAATRQTVAPTADSCIATLGLNILFAMRDAGPRQVIGLARHVADPVNWTLAWLAGRFDAAHALGAGRCRVRGVRREDHLVVRAELDVAVGGVEHDPAADAVHLFICDERSGASVPDPARPENLYQPAGALDREQIRRDETDQHERPGMEPHVRLYADAGMA
jgi:hypothetical protein